MNARATIHRSKVAAFFDLDGTLIPFPSLERRMFRALLYRRAIPARNAAHWIAEAVRLAPRGSAFVRQANKMYLRGVSVEATRAAAERIVSAQRLTFFPDALDRAAWHATQGHRIVLVSGTLQMLADCAARALQAALARCGIAVMVIVVATPLEAKQGRWTGRIAGAAMFGRAKANAVDEFAAQVGLDLGLCFAYGDSVHDRNMLERVGRPVAVNAPKALQSLAVRNGWQTAEWHASEISSLLREEERARITDKKAESLG